MDFLIQTIEHQVTHDFSFTLIEAIKYRNWFEYNNTKKINYLLTEDELYPNYIPVGSNDFVIKYLQKYYNKTPKPINIPEQLIKEEFLKRNVIIGTRENISKKCFVKSMDKIKHFTEIVSSPDMAPEGNLLISDIIEIESEWRAFIYKDKLVGLNNYCGDFTLFPDVKLINEMIKTYTNKPIACTIDVGVSDKGTFLIEVHDFFSCGLYGFSDSRIYPNMLSDWFNQYIKL